MSRRKLVQDVGEARRKAYRQLNADEVQEALWEALEKLYDAEVDIGDKAGEILQKRWNIKAKIPKPA